MNKKPKLAIFQTKEEEEDDEDEDVKSVKPIPLPSRVEANAPLLNDMKRIRDDPAEFQRYVDTRPNALSPTDSIYNGTMPIESFGLAMLRGMGYKEEKDKQVQPYLLEGRPGLLGLGAKIVHEKQSTSLRPAKQQQRKYICNGSVCQLAGTHRLVVVKQTDGVPGLDMIKVEALNLDGQIEELIVPKLQLILQDLDRLPETHPAHSIVAQVEAAHAARRRDDEVVKSPSRLWIQPHLRVLITQEKSKVFKKKGWIVSVNEAEKTCLVRIAADTEEEEYEFKERHLQTTVEVGKRAIIVRGAQKLRIGVVENKDKKRALVRFDDATEWVPLDDICEVKHV